MSAKRSRYEVMETTAQAISSKEEALSGKWTAPKVKRAE
jgi:hypothetical protein